MLPLPILAVRADGAERFATAEFRPLEIHYHRASIIQDVACFRVAVEDLQSVYLCEGPRNRSDDRPLADLANALEQRPSSPAKQQEMLEKLIAERKYVFGDGTLEVTASDVKETADLIRPVPRLNKRARTSMLSRANSRRNTRRQTPGQIG